MPCGGVRAPKSGFRLPKIVFTTFFQSWRLVEGFFSLAENRFYNLLPELVPYGGVSAPKSDFRLPKIVVYNLPPEPGVILGLKGSRIIGLQVGCFEG